MTRSGAEIVHPVAREEVDGWVRTMATAFLRDPGADTDRWVAKVQREWEPERSWGVRDRGRWVATLRTVARTITVPGADGATEVVSADALTNVTVAATHRRRGLMAAMLNASLRAARERGDPVSILIAAEWPIYGRFGYAPATLGAQYELHPSRRGCVIDADLTRVRHVDRGEFGDVAARVYDAARRGRPGQVDRDGGWWGRALGRDGWPEVGKLPHNWLVHDGDDGPDGLLAWTATGEAGLIPPLGTVAVWLLASADDRSYRDLWGYLTGLDGVDTVTLEERPIDEPARWLLRDARTLVMTEQVDYVWLRLLDVPAALAARRYATPGELVLEVTDDSEPSVAGRYRLSVGDDGGAACERTAADPDLTLTQRALAAAYLGGFGLRSQLIAGSVVERTTGALSRAEVMFTTPLAPWNATGF